MENELNFMIVGFNDKNLCLDKDNILKEIDIFVIRSCINGVFKSIALPKDFSFIELRDVIGLLFEDIK